MTRVRTSFVRRAAAAVALAVVAFTPVAVRAADPVVVFAAASLKGTLDVAGARFEAATGTPVTVSFAASSALARQIEEGAPADVFVSADLKWMNYLADKGLVATDTRVDLLGNRIVLVAPAGTTRTIDIVPGFPLATLLGDGRLAMGDPSGVPAGLYGKAALEKLGVWSSVESKVAPAENVRAALLLVSRQEAPLGIVYSTDAASDPGVTVVGTFPADSHPPIVYPVAQLKASDSPAAAAFLAFLKRPETLRIFADAGFVVPE